MITDDLPHVLRGHVLLLSLHKSKLSLLTVTLRLELLPFPSCRIVGTGRGYSELTITLYS